MLVDDIALTLQSDVGPKTAIRLIERFGSVEALFAASPREIRETSGLSASVASALAARACHRQAEQELVFLKKYGVQALVSTATDYPPLLKECADYPHVLYLKGNPELLRRPMIAFAGTRRVTSYGLKMCETLISRLAELMPEAVVVSGLSYGVDVACHRAALAAGVATIAVLPNGLTSIYPSHHTDIARDIVRSGGALLTEFHSTFTPTATIFLQRNRIVAGMCEGTVIVESPEDGGSLTTADFASGYDRCVMAVPGRATDKASAGTNGLIRQLRARMVCSAEDILSELGWERTTAKDAEPSLSAEREAIVASLGKDEQEVLECFRGRDIATTEELSVLAGFSLSELAPLLLGLEMAGMVRALPGNRYEKV